MIIIPTGVCKRICAVCIWIHQRAVRTWQPHELCTVYPTSASWRYAVILYILSAENKQTLSNPLKQFFFLLLKMLNSSFQSEDGQGPADTSWSSGHLQESLYDVGRGGRLLLTYRWRQAAVLWSRRGAEWQRCQAEELVINIYLKRQFPQFPPKANTSGSTL